MAAKTILAEAAESLATHTWTDSPKSSHRRHNYYAECAVCQEDIEPMAAVVLRVAERRIREQAGEPKAPILASNGHDFTVLGKHYAADLIAEGLPVEYQANGQED